MDGVSSSFLTSEVGWYLAPFRGFPLLHRGVHGVGAEPLFGSAYDVVQLFGLRTDGQGGLALLLLHPQYGIVGVAVDGLVL